MFMPDQFDCGSGAPLDWVQGQSDDCTTGTEGEFAGGRGCMDPDFRHPASGSSSPESPPRLRQNTRILQVTMLMNMCRCRTRATLLL